MIPLSRIAWGVMLLATALLIGGLVWWCGAVAGTVLSLPLLAMLPGFIRRNIYTAKWASLVLVFYVAGLLAEAYAMHARHVFALALSCVATLQFVSLLLFVRWTARERQAATAQTAA